MIRFHLNECHVSNGTHHEGVSSRRPLNTVGPSLVDTARVGAVDDCQGRGFHQTESWRKRRQLSGDIGDLNGTKVYVDIRIIAG